MNTMNEEDSKSDVTVENSIEFAMTRLNSDDIDTVLDTIIQVTFFDSPYQFSI